MNTTKLSRRSALASGLAFAAPAALALPPPVASDADDPAGHPDATMVEHAERAVDILRTRNICDGWTVDEAAADRMLSLLRASSPADQEDNGAAAATIEFCEAHGQSMDWLLWGDPIGMVSSAAARSPRAAALGQSIDPIFALIEEHKRAAHLFYDTCQEHDYADDDPRSMGR
jgi:hypothetical protein